MSDNSKNINREFLFNHILPFVSKPGRYIGNEINMTRKDLEQVDVRFALVFPDVYEVGMSYLGFPILYNILNKKKGIYAERVFAPWVDMEEQMRQKDIPLFSLETFSPLKDFDIIGFTFQYELHCTSIVNLIDLAGLPVESKEREGFPLVLLGGPSIYNPEPMANFIDVAVIGDGEDVSVEIAETVQKFKQKGATKTETLKELAKIKGVYVPAFYEPKYLAGSYQGIEPNMEDIPRRIKARTVSELDGSNYPEKPIVPMIQTTHDRVSLEIARGCSRGCRFCNAGFIYRPVRERQVEELVETAINNISNTGYDEISLVSLSTSDYTKLPELMESLNKKLSGRMVSLSFPSLRPESFTEQVAKFAKGVRKSGLTLAPEAGSQRLRDVINKATTEEALAKAVDLAFRQGWKQVKLYFMIGQPTEENADLQAMADLISKIVEIARLHRGKNINVSVSPFVPKPHTPFQWAKQDSMEETDAKLAFLSSTIKARNTKLSWRSSDIAAVEGVLARGDRKLSAVIKRAWELGSRLDGWSELWDFNRWEQAIKENGSTIDNYLKGFEIDGPLPWDHIDKGVTKKFLRDEHYRALGQNVTPDCRFTDCKSCGLMGEKICKEIIAKPINEKELTEITNEESETEEKDKFVVKNQTPISKRIVRVKYQKGESVRFLSHLDIMRMFERAMRRAQLPIAYTEGFNPRPKISYGPALATGYTSHGEYMDVHLATEEKINVESILTPHLPQGIEILDVNHLDKKPGSLAAQINRLDYEIFLNDQFDMLELDLGIDRLLLQNELKIERTKKGKNTRVYNIRPNILQLTKTPHGLSLQSAVHNGLSVRAEEVLEHLFPKQNALVKTARINRTNQFIQNGSKIQNPMKI